MKTSPYQWLVKSLAAIMMALGLTAMATMPSSAAVATTKPAVSASQQVWLAASKTQSGATNFKQLTARQEPHLSATLYLWFTYDTETHKTTDSFTRRYVATTSHFVYNTKGRATNYVQLAGVRWVSCDANGAYVAQAVYRLWSVRYVGSKLQLGTVVATKIVTVRSPSPTSFVNTSPPKQWQPGK